MKCEICNKEFAGHFRQKYCSDECRYEAWKKYLRERYKIKQQKIIDEKKHRLEEWKKNGSITANSVPYNGEPLPSEVLEKLIELAKKQQYSNIFRRDEKCYACFSVNNLVLHHISYSPIITVTLCKRCHEYLHKRLLAKQRVAPRVI